MHRAVSMRLAPHPCPSRLLLRRLAGHRHLNETSAVPPAVMLSISSSRPRLMPSTGGVSRHGQLVFARGISSTAPAQKGRRGGASALMPKRSGPARRKAPGMGKKKKPKVHGAPLSRVNKYKRLEQESKAKLEAMKAISPEDQAMILELAEEFLNTPLGQQEVGLNAYLRQKDPDAMMLNLGMTLSDDASKNALPNPSEGGTLPASPLLLQRGHGTPTPPDGVVSGSGGGEGGSTASLETMSSAPPPLVFEPGSSALPTAPLQAKHAGGTSDFNFLIRTLAAHGRSREARVRVVPEMKRRGVRLDEHTYTALLAGEAIMKDAAGAEKVWLEMLEDGVQPGAHAWSSRVNAHARAGKMKRALKLGKEMRDNGHPWCVVTYTSLIAGSTRTRNYGGAWRLWKEMIIWGVKPDVMAYTAMMKLCAETGQYEMAMTFLSDMDMDDQRPTRVTMETLFRATAKAPQWIRAYGNIVDDLVQRFIGLGLTPKDETYQALLLAYSSGGDADKVLQCIEEAHVLRGHTADLLGDGTPKLSWQTYCSALEAIARCCGAGRHRGTRPRWGILPGEDALVMDITALDVPEDDANRVRQMQMSTMEWDESGEADLRKGFRRGKRSKFRGVTTPEGMIGDEELERAIEDEYERVMQKTKNAKKLEERERLIQLGGDPDADDKIPKNRPRVLPDPRDDERIGAPMPSWLSTLQSSTGPGLEGGLEEAAQSVPLEIGDDGDESGRKDLGEGGERGGALEREEGWGEDTSSFGEGFRGDSVGEYDDEEELDDEEGEWESERQSLSDDDVGEEEISGNIRRDVRTRRGRGGRDAAQASRCGALRRTTMLDILEGGRVGGVGGGLRGKEESGPESDDTTLHFPDNMEEIMEEMRMLAQQDLDRRENRHKHLKKDDIDRGDADEDKDDDGSEGEEEDEEEEEGWSDGERDKEEEEEGEMEEGGRVGQWARAGADPEEEARAALEDIMAESASRKGRSLDRGGSSSIASPSGRITAASDFGREQSLADERDERGLQAMAEFHKGEEGVDEEEEEEYEDWTPLMHEGLKERTAALLGVVKILEVDAMAAARRADVESGFGGGRAGPAVEATMRARLRSLTEARLSKKAIKFVEEEYPKEGVNFGNDAALLVVEMFINTRGVGLAEAFAKTCKETYGLPPDRRILGAILNARARRGVAWSHEIPHVKRILDTLEQHKIKPHENELRFVRKLVDKGKFNHSWLPADPEAIAKKMRLEVKKSKPTSKAFFKVVSKITNAKYMIGSGRGKSRAE